MTKRRGRYIGIFRGGKESEITKTIAFLRGTDKANYPARQVPRAASRLVYVEPFSDNFLATAKLLQRVNSTRWTAVSSFVNGFTDPTAPTNVIDLKEILAPRAVITTNVPTGEQARRASQITGRMYRPKGGTGVSVPFGKGSGANQDTPAEVFAVIKSRALDASLTNTVTYVPGSVGF